MNLRVGEMLGVGKPGIPRAARIHALRNPLKEFLQGPELSLSQQQQDSKPGWLSFQ